MRNFTRPTAFIFTIVLSAFFWSCEVVKVDKTPNNPLIQAEVEAESQPTETQPSAEEEQAVKREVLIKMLSSMTGTDIETIEENLSLAQVDIPMAEITKQTILFIAAIDPETQDLAQKVKELNYQWTIEKKQSAFEPLIKANKELKVRISTLLILIAPDHEFDQPQDDGKFGAGIAEAGGGIIGAIVDAIIEGLIQVGLAISYNIDGQCKSFFYFNYPILEKTRGYVTLVDCGKNPIDFQ
ncbi:MAG: hypothetical protein HYU97_00290 [Deltaproteobacteria bacterium]|nr:hypothetical protein [Deltaproteobacteria bacterium]